MDKMCVVLTFFISPFLCGSSNTCKLDALKKDLHCEIIRKLKNGESFDNEALWPEELRNGAQKNPEKCLKIHENSLRENNCKC